MSLPTNTKSISPNEAEEMLRTMAKLPAPQGLEDRVHAALRSAPRTARILSWPEPRSVARGWMRGAAAAAIVFVVAGGGWGIYSRVQPAAPAKVIAMPRVTNSGGFSNAGAMRTPQTLNMPVTVLQPATRKTPDKTAVKTPSKTAKKPASRKATVPSAKANPSR